MVTAADIIRGITVFNQKLEKIFSSQFELSKIDTFSLSDFIHRRQKLLFSTGKGKKLLRQFPTEFSKNRATKKGDFQSRLTAVKILPAKKECDLIVGGKVYILTIYIHFVDYFVYLKLERMGYRQNQEKRRKTQKNAEKPTVF